MSKDIKPLIIEHMMLRPHAHPRDIYKLIYQGVFGVGHIVSEKAWDILVEEAGRINLEDHAEDPLIEPVSPDGSMVRVNLRQFINGGGDLKTLYEVMVKSAKHKGDIGVFQDYWNQYKELIDDGIFPVQMDELEALDEAIKTEGVKPRHHTEPYREAYYPAYRVVVMDVFRARTHPR